MTALFAQIKDCSNAMALLLLIYCLLLLRLFVGVLYLALGLKYGT